LTLKTETALNFFFKLQIPPRSKHYLSRSLKQIA